jgi:hypothetical protein
MKLNQTGLFLCVCFMAVFSATGQRLLTEARLQYNLTALPEKGQEELASAFKDATQTIWLRGNMVRIDFYSTGRQQSVIYNAANGSATLLRESGAEKYQWNLDSARWKQFNRQWTAIGFSETGENATLAGYNCQKVTGLYASGDSASIFYTSQIMPLARGYDPLFEGLKGTPVQYELVIGGLKVRYTLVSVQTLPVGASRFDVPKTGYKIIEAPEKEPH